MAFKRYTSETLGLKFKVKNFFGLIPMFAEITGKKPMGDGRFGLPPAILIFSNGWNKQILAFVIFLFRDVKLFWK